jgi:hypothetical protein
MSKNQRAGLLSSFARANDRLLDDDPTFTLSVCRFCLHPGCIELVEAHKAGLPMCFDPDLVLELNHIAFDNQLCNFNTVSMPPVNLPMHTARG